MARIYVTDYVLLPWEDRFVYRHTLHDEVRKHYPDCALSALPVPNVQQLLLVEVFEDDAFDGPPHMVLRGYVFLFWSQLLPDMPDHYVAALKTWIDENDVYSVLEQQMTEHRNRERLLKDRSKTTEAQPMDDDTEPSDDIEF